MARLCALLVLLLACAGTTTAGFVPGMLADLEYFCLASFVTYCPVYQIRNQNMEPGEKLYGVYESSLEDMTYVFRDSRRNIIVGFRGAVRAQNWFVTNFASQMTHLAWPHVPRNVQAHLGYRRAYMAMQSTIQQWVAEARRECPECQVVVTGHSLGGALAPLCALDLHLQGHNPKLYTYGAPRVGDRFFAAFFNSLQIPTVRYVNRADVCAHVPARDGGYEHIAGEVWETNNGLTICDDAQGESPICSFSVPMSVTNMQDHMTHFGTYCLSCNGPLNAIF